MTGNEGQELRERLGGALDVIEPSPAPLGAVLRQGKAIRRKRRAGIAACIAVAAGIAIAVPSLLPNRSAPQPASPPKPVITVHPGRTSVPGEIAYGTVNGEPWKIVLGKDGSVRSPGFAIAGSGYAQFSLGPGQDASFAGMGNEHLVNHFGQVRRDVVTLSVSLSDGRVLVLRPVELFGRSYVGFQVPAQLAITKMVANGPYGELGYAVAFKGMVANWLRTDEPVPPMITARIASGVTDGKTWSITGYAGPWGLCFSVIDLAANTTDCMPSSPSGRQPIRLMMTDLGTASQPGDFIGRVAPDVASMRLSLAGGRTETVPAVTLAGRKYVGLAYPASAGITGWAVYDAAGHALASGSGAPSLGKP